MLEITQTRIIGFGQQKEESEREGERAVPLSLKDSWESTFPSAVCPWDPGWSSQQRCPTIRGVSFHTQTLSQSSSIVQAHQHTSAPSSGQQSGCIALQRLWESPLLLTLSLYSKGGHAKCWLVVWVPMGSPSSCAQQLLSWQNACELECWGVCKAWCSPQVSHQFRWKRNRTIDWCLT